MRVKVEILPWISQSMRPNVVGSIRFEHCMSGTSFRDLMLEMAESDPDVARIIYDRDRDELRFPVKAVINEQLLEFLQGMGTELSEGDSVTLMATYTGG